VLKNNGQRYMGISQKDIKLLWGNSGSRCAICRTELIQDKKAGDLSYVLGEQAHIVGEKQNSPRGDSSLSVEERNKYNNLILLCPNHHTEIDKNEYNWSIEKLHQQKSKHEKWVNDSLNISSPPQQKLHKHDKKLYKQFLNTLPSKGSIQFIYEHNFHYEFKQSRLEELFSFSEEWDNAEFEFINEELEQIRNKLLILINEFLYKLGNSVRPLHINELYTIFPMSISRGDKLPENLRIEIQSINLYGDPIYETHQKLVRLGKKLLGS
jgi:hypothetical protein